MNEQWRPVAGFDNRYEVSDRGRVRRVETGRVMRPANLQGYRRVELSPPPTKVLVHRLVAMAFLGDPTVGKEQINHKNGERADNRVLNLEWCNQSENLLHARRELYYEPIAKRRRRLKAEAKRQACEKPVEKLSGLGASERPKPDGSPG